jgi:MerR family transcriptional regulator, light-induced transcriptional regulator
MESSYSIKDLEHMTGIKAHTLRIWEQRYDIVVPMRTETNIRYYSDEDLKTLLNVSVLIQKGWRISKIADLTKEQLCQIVFEEAMLNGSQSAQVTRMVHSCIDLDEHSFSEVLDASIKEIGEEATFTKLVGEFIHQIGYMWQTDALGVAHEHFASNIIKQKIYAALDRLEDQRMSAQNPGILLYLPQDELHELGLLYLHYLLKSQGKVVLNLGQSLPLEHLKHIFKDSTSFRIVVSVWTTQPLPEQLAQYAKDARSFMGSVPLWVTGLAVSDWANTDSNIVVYPTLAQLGHALVTMA